MIFLNFASSTDIVTSVAYITSGTSVTLWSVTEASGDQVEDSVCHDGSVGASVASVNSSVVVMGGLSQST